MISTPEDQRIPSGIKVSMYIAFVGGILTPLLETIRRWHQIPDPRYFINWFDDYLIGAILIYSAWKTYKTGITGIRFLIAAWGFATGMAFSSFVSQILALNQPDPAPVPYITVVIVKGVMLMICVACLSLSIKRTNSEG